MSSFQMAIGIAGGLAIFLFGMKVMSEGLQKVAGERMRKFLSAITDHRVLGVLTGFVVTSAIQSSSATTVMLVGFVHAGMITLIQSVGVIMGANIGTTMTGWLVAILGFKVKIAAMALPAVAIGFFSRFLGSKRLANWGEFLIGFGILFIGLDFMKDAVEGLKESGTVLGWLAACKADTLFTRMVAILVGAAVTAIIQSSSAALAITMTLAAQGMIDLETACALAIGQNIGTTITANLASIGTSSTAKRAARVHLLFNLLGSLWPILVLHQLISVVDHIVPGGTGGEAPSAAVIAARLAAFHTLFNLVNTVVFLPFTGQLAWVATKMVRPSKAEVAAGLKFLDTKILGSPPMALHAARSELLRMLHEVRSMLDKVLTLISSPTKKLGKVADDVVASEQIVDMLARKITEYLVSITELETSEVQSQEIIGMMHVVSDIERMGDHSESLLKLATKMYDKKLPLTDVAQKEIGEIGDKAEEFIDLLSANMMNPSLNLMTKARAIEQTINDMRMRMREGHMARLQAGECEVGPGLVFIDMLTSFEKIGDHSFNVAEMLAGER